MRLQGANRARPIEVLLSEFLLPGPRKARGGENLRWGAWSGKKKEIRMVFCKTCKRSFSERKGTPLFQSRLPEKEAMGILQHLADGCGVRQTGRLTDHTKDTVALYAKKAGPHAHALHDELVAFSPGDD